MSKVAKLGVPDSIEMKKGTYSGVKMQLLTVHGTANTSLVNSDLDLTQISVKATLNRNKADIVLFDDTLANLLKYFNYKRGYHRAVNGILTVPKASGVFEENTRFIFLPFTGVINVDQAGDILTVNVSAHRTATYSSNVDTDNSTITYDLEKGVGYEAFLCQIDSKPVDAGAANSKWTLGDNIMKVMLMNDDHATYALPAIENMTFSSDRLQITKTFTELIDWHLDILDTNVLENWGITRGIFANPQNFVVLDGTQTGAYMHNVELYVKWNAAQIAANKNRVMFTRFTQTKEQIAKAKQMKAKHDAENQAVIFNQ